MNELEVTEYQGIRVLTTQQLAEAYGTTEKAISNNFNRNKDKYTEGKHFICLTGNDLREFKGKSSNLGFATNANRIYLWTKKGAFLHAKSLNTDTAWEVYDRLIDSYFHRKQNQLPQTTDGKIALLAQGHVELKEEIDSVKRELEDFKQDMPVLGIEENKITNAVRRKGLEALGGKESNAYADKSLRGKLYSDIYRELKRQFGVSTYKAIKRSQCETALSIVEAYEPPLILSEQINTINAQMRMEGVA